MVSTQINIYGRQRLPPGGVHPPVEIQRINDKEAVLETSGLLYSCLTSKLTSDIKAYLLLVKKNNIRIR